MFGQCAWPDRLANPYELTLVDKTQRRRQRLMASSSHMKVLIMLATPQTTSPSPLDALKISPVSFGTAEIGNLYRDVSEHEAWAVMEAAFDNGITLFDTSPSYGAGLSELRLGAFLRSRPRSSYTLSTKVGRYLQKATAPVKSPFVAPLPFEARFDYTYDGVMRSFEQSTLRMGLPSFDIMFIHDLDRRNHGDRLMTEFEIARNGSIRALEELKRNGDIKAFGIAINDADVAAMAVKELPLDVVLLAGRYSLLERSGLDDFFPAIEHSDVRVFLAGVYNSGILATGARANATYNYATASEDVQGRVRQIEDVCAAFGISLPTAALRFVLGHPRVMTAIIGTTRADRIKDLAYSRAERIAPLFWQALKDKGIIAAEAPVHA